MNEIKKIHLGRQSFTIAIDAYKALHNYLEAIRHQTGTNDEVAKEVESRMAELLTERGIDGDKVVLPEDVAFLREQLGEPSDFKDDSDDNDQASDPGDQRYGARRLYRDVDNAAIAGVASGLAAYFSIDPLIVRLIFVALAFAGGAGVFIYILLWWLAPPAKTPSERLQMRGEPVTIHAIKESMDRADVRSAASRLTKSTAHLTHGVVRLVRIIVGLVLVVGAFFVLMAAAASSYLFAHGLDAEGTFIFPHGAMQVGFLAAVVGSVVVLGVLCALWGVSLLRRKPVVNGWVFGVLASLLLLGSGAATGLGVAIAPQVSSSIQSMQHDVSYTMPAFTSVDLSGTNAQYSFQPDNRYMVEVHYVGGKQDDSALAKQVVNGTLQIDSSNYTKHWNVCDALCFFSRRSLSITIHAPSLAMVQVHDHASLSLDQPFESPSLTLSAAPNASIDFTNLKASALAVDFSKGDGTHQVVLQNVKGDQDNTDDSFVSHTVRLAYPTNVSVQLGDSQCSNDPLVFLQDMPAALTINDKPIATDQALQSQQNPDQNSIYNCVMTH